MRKWRLQIRHIHTKHSLFIALVIITVSILFTFFTFRQFKDGMMKVSESTERFAREVLYRQLEDRARGIVTVLSEDLAAPLDKGDYRAIRELLAEARSYKDVAHAYLYDSDGRAIADGTEKNHLAGEVLSDEADKKAVLTERLTFLRKGDILEVFFPVRIPERRLGSVRAGFYTSGIETEISDQSQAMASLAGQSLRKALSISALMSAVLLFVGIFFVLRITQFLIRPIIRLNEAARKVGNGDLTVKVDIKSGDELEELAGSFNQMTSDLYSRQRELTTLHDSAKALTSILEVDSLLDNCLNAITDIFKASKASIMFIENESLVVKRSFGWKPEEVPRGKPFAVGEGVAGYVAKERKSILVNDVNSHPLFKRETGRIWRGSRNLLCVPMIHKDKLEGVINIQDRIDGKRFTKTDVEYAEIIASYTALSLANIELVKEEMKKTRMEEELKTAEAVQKTLFSKEAPQIQGLELANFFESSTETGGDWFGYIEDPKLQRLAILIGDVSGHGVPTALVTAAVNSFVRTLDILKLRFYEARDLALQLRGSKAKAATKRLSGIENIIEDPLMPAGILKLLNKIVLDIGKNKLAMTFFASLLDLKTKTLTFANAGHTQPYLCRSEIPEKDRISGSRRNIRVLSSFGVRLGDDENVDFKEDKIRLKKDDVLLWYTDGIVECENGEGDEFGDKRLSAALEDAARLSAPEIRDRIISGAYEFFGNTPRKDDVSLIVAKVK